MRLATSASLVLSSFFATALSGCGGGGGGGGAPSAPGAPRSLSASVVAALTVRFAWSAVEGADDYHLFVAASPDVTPLEYRFLPEGQHFPSIHATTIDVDGLSPGVTYYAVVVAGNGGFEGDPSPVASATLPPSEVLAVLTTPRDEALDVRWPAVVGATLYDVYAAPGDGWTSATFGSLPPGRASALGVSTRQVLLDGLENGVAHQVIVVARNQAGASADSTPVFATPSGRGTFDVVGAAIVGNGPAGCATADFDLDGFADLAVAVRATDVVAVLRGAGDGQFFPPDAHAVGDAPCAVVAADFDGDGAPDLAVVNETGAGVSVLLGDGVGGFGGATSYAVRPRPVAIAVGALRGAGQPLDLVVANRDDDSVSVLLGNGAGGFGAQTAYPTGAEPVHVVVADFDQDGHLDVVTADADSNRVSFLRGTGAGALSSADPTLLSADPAALSVEDFDGDGDLDVFVVFQPTGLNPVVLRAVGDGSFFPAGAASTGAVATSVATGDFDGDGRTDVVVAAQGNGLVVLRGDGSGRFLSHFALPGGAAAAGPIAVADWNGDGTLDLAVSDPASDRVVILLGSPD
jgi:hypothetical protein